MADPSCVSKEGWTFTMEFNRGAVMTITPALIGSRKGANLVNCRQIFGVFGAKWVVRSKSA